MLFFFSLSLSPFHFVCNCVAWMLACHFCYHWYNLYDVQAQKWLRANWEIKRNRAGTWKTCIWIKQLTWCWYASGFSIGWGEKNLLLGKPIWAGISVTDNIHSWLTEYHFFPSSEKTNTFKKLNNLPIVITRMNGRARIQEQFSLCPKLTYFSPNSCSYYISSFLLNSSCIPHQNQLCIWDLPYIHIIHGNLL